jgi:Protein of unknown function (DUF3551)
MSDAIWSLRPTFAGVRRVLAAGGLLAALATAHPANAQTLGHAPWCVDLGDLGPGVLECQYYTYAQCHARAWGVTNVCIRNPWYVPERPPASRERRATRK